MGKDGQGYGQRMGKDGVGSQVAAFASGQSNGWTGHEERERKKTHYSTVKYGCWRCPIATGDV